MRLASDTGGTSADDGRDDRGNEEEVEVKVDEEKEKGKRKGKVSKPLSASVASERVERVRLRQHGYLLCCTVDSDEEGEDEYYVKDLGDGDDDVEEEEEEEEEPVCEASCEVWDDPQIMGGIGGEGGRVVGSSQQRKGSASGPSHSNPRSTKGNSSNHHNDHPSHFRTRAASTRKNRTVQKPSKYDIYETTTTNLNRNPATTSNTTAKANQSAHLRGLSDHHSKLVSKLTGDGHGLCALLGVAGVIVCLFVCLFD